MLGQTRVLGGDAQNWGRATVKNRVRSGLILANIISIWQRLRQSFQNAAYAAFDSPPGTRKNTRY
jgi:hypothetical protein